MGVCEMTRKTGLILLAILQLAAACAYAEGLDFLSPQKYAYQLRLSRAASYQLAPGDYLEVIVTSGAPDARTQQTVLKRVQVIKIVDLKTNAVQVNLVMNKRQLLKMQQALSQREPSIALHIVEKQPRPGLAAAPDDPLPDLDFENTTDLAQQTDQAD